MICQFYPIKTIHETIPTIYGKILLKSLIKGFSEPKKPTSLRKKS